MHVFRILAELQSVRIASLGKNEMTPLRQHSVRNVSLFINIVEYISFIIFICIGLLLVAFLTECRMWRWVAFLPSDTFLTECKNTALPRAALSCGRLSYEYHNEQASFQK
jgi:hypothetical protein